MADKTLRLGIIGMGGIGVHHARYIAAGGVEGAALAAFSSRDAGRRAAAAGEFGGARGFASQTELMRSGLCDAVIICTPHLQHVGAIVEAFEAGLHVLVEKPLAVTMSEARRALAAAGRRPELRFGIMLNQRSNPLYRWLREQILTGGLGEVQRITWTATHWFRPNSYYTASSWRATWAGEGGGLIINQCHHNLDLLVWMTGMMPRRVTAVGFFGKRHPIETEDEVSAILEYESGAIGHFYAATGEYPGVNRLEIAGTRARVVVEDERVTVTRGAVDSREVIRTSAEPFGSPGKVVEAGPVLAAAVVPEHKAIVQDFVRNIREGLPAGQLLAPAAEDLGALELGHAMVLSAARREAVELPVAERAYEEFLGSRRGRGS